MKLRISIIQRYASCKIIFQDKVQLNQFYASCIQLCDRVYQTRIYIFPLLQHDPSLMINAKNIPISLIETNSPSTSKQMILFKHQLHHSSSSTFHKQNVQPAEV